MKKTILYLLIMIMIITSLASCAGCSGYTSRLPGDTYSKISRISFGISGDEYTLDRDNTDMDSLVSAIEKTLKSGKIDLAFASGQVKMPCDDDTVEYNKKSFDMWIELSINGSQYKKAFFTLNNNDTQTVWIYATRTDSYNDGGFLEYYQCDCRELLEWIDSYSAK